MNEEAYANHIIQKHRLAVAIAVIKSKPTNLTSDEVIQQIRDKLNPIINISDDEASINSDIVCSEDFDTYIEEDDTNFDTLPIEERANDVRNTVINTINFDTLPNKIVVNDVSKTVMDTSNFNTLANENIVIDTTNFDTLPIDIEEYVIEIIPYDTANDNTQTKERTTHFDSLPLNLIESSTDINNYPLNPIENCTEINYNLYNRAKDDTVSILESNLEDELLANNVNENKHLSKDIVKDSLLNITSKEVTVEEDLDRTMTIYEDDRDKDSLNDSMNVLEGLEEDNNLNVVENEVLSEVFSLMKNADLAIEMEIDSQRTFCESLQAPTPKSPKNTNQLLEIANEDIASQKTIQYTIDTGTNTYYSQSQTQNIVIEPHFIKNKEINKRPSLKVDNVAITKNTNDEAKNMDIDENNTVDDTLLTNEREIRHSEREGRFSNEELNDHNEVLSDEDLSTSQTVLPFKIIEEMNKIKACLTKRQRKLSTDGHSTDSGYRSDSQKSLRNSLHISENWLNQSGCSLLRHLLQCALTNSTQDINNEISEVLGNLIDSLHADEKYPIFLEEIIENIDKLLKDLHEEPNDGDFPLQKEEYLHRLILLNKSRHTQKYTISKINSILLIIHNKIIQTDSIYEITDIDRIENLSYIFHLLTIIIKKYIKNQPKSSQMTNSQLTDFKKSYIAEVWRKKWNPIQETTVFSDVDNKCVLSECMDVLNKIVVSCMEGYSLISYAALECLNLLQN